MDEAKKDQKDLSFENLVRQLDEKYEHTYIDVSWMKGSDEEKEDDDDKNHH